jgi:hypothetical protein
MRSGSVVYSETEDIGGEDWVVKTSLTAAIGVLVLIGLAGRVGEARAEDEPATKFVKLFYKGTCDDKNNRLWLSNSHTFKTIQTTVRWKAAGGKDLKEQFLPPPSSEVEIGCAAEGEIVEAQFAAF